MPGNEVGDRVHNFFAQDSVSQSQNQSQVAEGNRPVLNNNLWVGNQRQVGIQSSNQKNYISHQSDFDRGQGTHPSHSPQGTHSSLRPEFTTNQPQSQQPNLNGYMYQRQVYQPRQDEADHLEVDTESNRHKLNPRGLSPYELQQGTFSDIHLKRSETSESPVSFDFFGGQQQMTGRSPGMLQAGFSDMQQLQQEAMLRKMQEFQRQKELSQLDARQHNSPNQVPFFSRQAPGNHANDLTSGTRFPEASTNYPWAAEQQGNTILRQRASLAMQGSSGGLGFPSDQSQTPYPVGLVHQQADQSLYGVPISGSRSGLKQFPQIAAEKPSLQQMSSFNNSFSGNQGDIFQEQNTMQEGSVNRRHGFQGKNFAGGMNMEYFRQVNSMNKSVPVNEFQGRHEVVGEIGQEKKAFEASSQDTVALDPTEEKILFGSDDNIWDAFGRGTMSGETSNLLDGMGSWSALMQSAVGETSSSDNGVQEEWTGRNFQNPEYAVVNHHQPSTYTDSAKRQTAMGDGNLQMAPALNFGYAPLSEDANINSNYNNPHGSQQFEQDERLRIDSSQRPTHHQSSGGGGTKWLNQSHLQKPLVEGSKIHGNALSHNGEVNAKNIPGHWTPQQSGFSQPFNKPMSWNMMGSESPGEESSLNIRENGYSLQSSRSNQQKRLDPEETSHGDGIWKVTAPIAFEPLKSNIIKNAVVPPNPRASEESGQFVQNHQLSYWKNVDSLGRSKGNEPLGTVQQHPNKSPQFLGTSLNIYDKQDDRRNEVEQNSNKRENSNDSYHSNSVSQNTSTGGLRDIMSSDFSDSRALSSGKQKGIQLGRKTSAPTRKFQYHPMGNLDEDVEPSIGTTRPNSLSQVTSQQNSQGMKIQEQGHFGKSNHFSLVYSNSSEAGKGKSPDLRGDPKGFDEVLSRGNPPSRPAQMDQSVGLFASNKASQPSQNMLELLHKVDQSKEHGNVARFASSERNPPSEVPETENSDGSGGCLQRSQSSTSQGFGLQLAPPSQRLPVQNHLSHSSMVNQDTRDRVHTQLGPSTVQSLFPSQQIPQGESVNNRFSPGVPYSRSQIQNQQMSGERVQVSTNQSPNASLDRQVSQSKPFDESGTEFAGQSAVASVQVGAESIPFEKPNLTSLSRPQQGAFPNIWTNVPDAHKVASYFSQSHQSNAVESSSSARKFEDQDKKNSGNSSKEFGTNFVYAQGFNHREDHQAKGTPNQNGEESEGKEPIVKHVSDSSFDNSVSMTQRDIAAFGHSLKPNAFHQSYSLLNQMRVMKNVETDPNIRGLKRFKGAENISEGHQLSSKSLCQNEVSTTDASSQKVSEPADKLEGNSSFQLGNESQNHSAGNNPSLVRVEHPQDSPQTAPSWFNQYGSFRNGQQMLSMFDAHKAAAVTAKIVEQPPAAIDEPFASVHTLNSMEDVVNVSADINRNDNIAASSAPASVANERLSSSYLLPTADVNGLNVLILRPKKRKNPTTELCPWHKEVSQGSVSLQTISVAEVDWAKAANRLTEKIEDDPGFIEDVFTNHRAKRRLKLTTQLMQQLLRPPPAYLLSADAGSNYKSAVHSVSRLALGDACSLLSSNSSNLLSAGANMHDEQHLSNVMEGFMDRARKLENELLRLDKRASVSELRLECQEVETFSVINRFAKYHLRAKPDRADTSQASAAASNVQISHLQRYVTAVPLPRNLPERVHCLSL